MPVINLDTDTATAEQLRGAAELIADALRARRPRRDPRRCERRRGFSPDLVRCTNSIPIEMRRDTRYCSQLCKASEKARRKRDRRRDAATPWTWTPRMVGGLVTAVDAEVVVQGVLDPPDGALLTWKDLRAWGWLPAKTRPWVTLSAQRLYEFLHLTYKVSDLRVGTVNRRWTVGSPLPAVPAVEVRAALKAWVATMGYNLADFGTLADDDTPGAS